MTRTKRKLVLLPSQFTTTAKPCKKIRKKQDIKLMITTLACSESPRAAVLQIGPGHNQQDQGQEIHQRGKRQVLNGLY